MMLEKDKYLNKINLHLALLKYYIAFDNTILKFNINTSMESFITDMFNLVYDYDLINMNTLKPGFPTIDLGDTKNKISVQVTGDITSSKITKTLDAFKKTYTDKYDRVIFFLLKDKKNYTRDFTKSFSKFSSKNDIKDFNDLFKDISNLNIELIKIVYNYLKENLINMDEFLKADVLYEIQPDSEIKSFVNALKIIDVVGLTDDEIIVSQNDLRKLEKDLIKLRKRARLFLNYCLIKGELKNNNEVEFYFEDLKRYFPFENFKEIDIDMKTLINNSFISKIDFIEKNDFTIDYSIGIDYTWHVLGEIKKEFSQDLIYKIIVNLDFTLLDKNN